MIYIDADGDGKGNTGSLTEGSEKITFDDKHPWDYALRITGTTGVLYNAAKTIKIPLADRTGDARRGVH
jgi:hypothetical protein